MQPQSGLLRGTSRRGAGDTRTGGGQWVVRLSDGGQSHASARFPDSRFESPPLVSTACAVHGQKEHGWEGHTREQKVMQEQGAPAPGAWGYGRRRRDLEGAEGGPRPCLQPQQLLFPPSDGSPRGLTCEGFQHTQNEVKHCEPGPAPWPSGDKPHTAGALTAPPRVGDCTRRWSTRGTPAAAELRRPRAGLPRARSEDPQAGPGRRRGAQAPVCSQASLSFCVAGGAGSQPSWKAPPAQRTPGPGTLSPHTHRKHFRRSTSQRSTGAGCRKGPGGPGRCQRNTPSLKVIIPREKEAISQVWYDCHFASSSVFAGACEISLIKDSVRLALPPQRPCTSIWEPPGGGCKLGHGRVSLESGRQPPDPPALVAGAALRASGLCSLLFPASANLATRTHPDRRAPPLYCCCVAVRTPGRPHKAEAHSHRRHRTRQKRGPSGSWRTARAGQENASLPFTRVSFNPDREAAVRAVVRGEERSK